MNASAMSSWGAIAVSVLASLSFTAALIIAYMAKDQANLSLLIGAVISNFSTAVSFWLGSSAGSQRKDEILAQKGQS
jgi:hypothetical protein